MITRRHQILALPALIGAAGCADAPGSARPIAAGRGGGRVEIGGFTVMESGTPTPEEVWASLPPEVRRRLTEDAAFSGAAVPGLAGYTPVPVSEEGFPIRGYSFAQGRVGALTWSARGDRRDSDLIFGGDVYLQVGGLPLDPIGGGSVAWATRTHTSRWVEVLEAQGSLFPMREGAELTVTISLESTSPTSPTSRTRRTDSLRTVRRWRPWELWTRLLVGDLRTRRLLDRGRFEPPGITVFPAFLAGDMWELRKPGESDGYFALYSELLGMRLATGRWGGGGSAPSSAEIAIDNAFSMLSSGTRPEDWRFRLTYEGEQRLAVARAAEQTHFDEAAARSARLPAADRARASNLFRTAFQVWQAGDMLAAFMAFRTGLELDPANGIGHYYAGDAALKALDRPLDSRGEHLRAVAAHRLRRFHMTAAARFSPDSREGIEAAGILRG